MVSTILAFGGKGGSGKTTLAALVLRELIRLGKSPVLAVDADPNATLALTLGAEVTDTIADLRDRMGKAAQEVSEIPKDRLMDQWLNELLSEQVAFDLLAMGRPEGPKCYCYVNALLRRYLKELRSSYPVIVVDCEAGMEYLSRLTVDDVDTLVLVAEPTAVGLTTAKRIAQLADSLPVSVKRRILVLNKIGAPGTPEQSYQDVQLPEVDATLRVPFDTDLYERCIRGEPIDDNAGGAVRSVVEELTRLALEPMCEQVKKHI
jgi:CO dehydrogenase maturation factor